ncbi:hypothetical protein BaRGS_00021821 [Batillaria attramentaria]|uniref:Uncharacterized protein n=1 Tax=Batillaria attramentaria TaxID=370345 RepID=A0ABD0KIY5_9CAEN
MLCCTCVIDSTSANWGEISANHSSSSLSLPLKWLEPARTMAYDVAATREKPAVNARGRGFVQLALCARKKRWRGERDGAGGWLRACFCRRARAKAERGMGGRGGWKEMRLGLTVDHVRKAVTWQVCAGLGRAKGTGRTARRGAATDKPASCHSA